MNSLIQASTILNVDDTEAARYAKTRVLRSAGFRVIEAATGSEALSMARSEHPDLILLDTKLPDINGFDVCHQLKSNPATNDIFILQTSASFLKIQDKVNALNGGADNYLAEPIEPEELIANVKALLRMRDTEKKLRDSESRFRQLAENITDVFWIFSPSQPQLMYVSPAYETMWGGKCETLHANPFSWQDTIHDDDRERVSHKFLEVLQSKGIYDEEYRITLPDHKQRWIKDRAFQVDDHTGEFYRIVRISQDVTAQKISEQKLRDSDRLKDEFLATLAHELRNPLGPILNSVELLQLPGGKTPEMIDKSLNMIMRQTQHLCRLVNDLLDVSRITQGKVSIRPEPVEVNSFLSAAIEVVSSFFVQRGHRFDTAFPEHPVWIMGDTVRLTQIVCNLLNNAAKYTPHGGIVTLSVFKSGEYVHIVVKDNGIGISAEKIDHIFDLFAQAEHTSDRAQDGLGIGLSLVRELTLLHHGRSHVKSEGAGKGSCFTIELPLMQERVNIG